MFSDLLGNDQAKQMLRRLVAAGRVPNALLFAGPEGVGKRQFATELARSFLCTEPVESEGCGRCPACQRAGHFEIPEAEKKDDFARVFFSHHADVGTVVPFKRNILVDAIRDLEREAHFRPFEAKARFFFVDGAEKLNEAASNALLKTLEEPPPESHIVLITQRPDALLATIRSRCQMVRFAPVEKAEIERYLVEKCGMPPEDARLAAGLSMGSVGRAATFDLEKHVGIREPMLELLASAILRNDVAAALRSGEQMNDARNKDDFELSLTVLEGLIRDLWLIRNGSAEQILNSDISERLLHLANAGRRPALSDWLAEIELLRQRLQVNINKKVATDALVIGMAAR